MLTNGENKDRVSYALMTVAWKLFELNKKLQNFGTDTELFESEIHMIMYIKDNPDLHVSGLANKIGVTKGAVSQTVTKLVKKGMVLKVRDDNNLSRTLLRLTPKGKIAYREHEKLHYKFDIEVEKLLSEATKDQKSFLLTFLADLEIYIDNIDR